MANLLRATSSIFYFLTVLGLVIFNVFGIYLFIHYGENKKFTTLVSVVFAIIFLILLATSFTTLQFI